MRLPTDSMDAVALIRHAIDRGMRYIDTSRGYGESELILGRALRDGYREKVLLSSKCSPWIKKVQESDDGSADSVRRRIDETLLRLDVNVLDFYQVWNIDKPEAWDMATRKGGMVDGIRKAMSEGLVRHTGFTSHEKPENLLRYLPQADWCEILLLSYNLLNRDYEPAIALAHKLGIGTIVMNPVGGGKLTEESSVFSRLAADVGAASVTDLAVRYVLTNPNVDTILCGMSRIADADDTMAAAERTPFDAAQMGRINQFLAERTRESVHFCTACGYCQPCPAGIQIPGIMAALYEDRFLGLAKSAVGPYTGATRDVKPTACTECGTCESKCTQNLAIMDELKKATARFAAATAPALA
jgi:hypothetical protein